MGAVRSAELVMDRAEAMWVWDTSGRRYLDATASLWYANIGHGRPEIADAVAAQLRRLDAYSTFNDVANRPVLQLTRRLADHAPMSSARVFLASGGADGIDTAAKLARRYFKETGEPRREHIVTRTHGYHGTHGFGTSMAGIDANRQGYGPLLEQVSVVPWDSPAALRAELDRLGDRAAAFFVEPVIGAGGVYPPPAGYLEEVAAICADAGVLLVVDSVICGFGRLGTWFGIERWNVRPDMLVFAKGVTSGYLPLGGVLVSDRIAEPFWSRPDAPAFRHGATYAGHPTVCAAALANLDILEGERLIERGATLEQPLLRALEPLGKHPLVREVRGGTGFLASIELDGELLARRPNATAELAAVVREEGVLLRAMGSAVACSPPLIAEQEHIDLIPDALEAGLDRLVRDR